MDPYGVSVMIGAHSPLRTPRTQKDHRGDAWLRNGPIHVPRSVTNNAPNSELLTRSAGCVTASLSSGNELEQIKFNFRQKSQAERVDGGEAFVF